MVGGHPDTLCIEIFEMSQSFKMDEQTFKKERNNDGQYMIMAFMFQCLFGSRATDGFCLTSFSFFFFLLALGLRDQITAWENWE